MNYQQQTVYYAQRITTTIQIMKKIKRYVLLQQMDVEKISIMRIPQINAYSQEKTGVQQPNVLIQLHTVLVKMIH